MVFAVAATMASRSEHEPPEVDASLAVLTVIAAVAAEANVRAARPTTAHETRQRFTRLPFHQTPSWVDTFRPCAHEQC